MNKSLMILVAAAYLVTLFIYAIFKDPDVDQDAIATAKEAPVEQVAESHKDAANESSELAPTPEPSEEAVAADEVRPTSEGAAVAIDESVQHNVADSVITDQRVALANSTAGKGFGPQSPRDIDSLPGNNKRVFATAPAYTDMNLCNIHFHKNAEHKGGEFSTYAGNGDGQGYQSGYMYNGDLTAAELTPTDAPVCPSKHGGLFAGDTIEVHYVHTTAQVEPGPTLGACLSDAIKNPQLRVEAQVYVLVNDEAALDFNELAAHGAQNGLRQALNIPTNTGAPVLYAGSTTGPGYNEKGSPFQVTWSVRPKVAKVNVASVGEWCKGNTFDEDHGHGVRNLVINPDLLAPIQ